MGDDHVACRVHVVAVSGRDAIPRGEAQLPGHLVHLDIVIVIIVIVIITIIIIIIIITMIIIIMIIIIMISIIMIVIMIIIIIMIIIMMIIMIIIIVIIIPIVIFVKGISWGCLRRSHGLSARRARRTKSRGPKGLHLEVGARRAPRLLVS